jgi:hypothetical protein
MKAGSTIEGRLSIPADIESEEPAWKKRNKIGDSGI